MSSDAIVIVAAKRTPIGAFQGTLSGATAPHLGAAAIEGAVSACGIDAGDIDRILMGCVLPAGLGQAPARQAALDAGVPEGVPCVTVRPNTERPVTVEQGTNTIVGQDREQILAVVNDVLNNGGKCGRVPELWDGRAAERIKRILNDWLQQQPAPLVVAG